MKFVFLLIVTAIFAASFDKEDANRNDQHSLINIASINTRSVDRNGNSLINITSVNTRSVEACCNEKHLLRCTQVTVDPVALLSGEDINILGSDLVFDSTVEPHGFVYHNTLGDEAVITYNNKTGNMFGRMSTHEDKHYFIEKCHYGQVIKEYDLSSFGELEMGEEHGGGRSMEKVDARVEDMDNTTIVTYSIMFYYTQAFEDTTADIDGFLDQLVSIANTGYINSQIPIRAQRFCSEKATINEVNGNNRMLEAFWQMKDYDGSTTNLRNSADIAFLLTNVPYSISKHTGMAHFPWSNKKVGFCLKSRANGDYTFAHELGHTMGAYHNRETGHINPVHSKGQGHLIAKGTANTGLRTIMAYPSEGHPWSGMRNFWSNPRMTLPESGTPLGVEGVSDNAGVLTKNRFTYAATGDESGQCGSTE